MTWSSDQIIRLFRKIEALEKRIRVLESVYSPDYLQAITEKEDKRDDDT